ncbi:Jag N-terminal domain-containing protein [Bacillus coahuilensis]|uniref:Jag N-terminal domain-containing protein n=1 Tax=Bacillus coahuilensis TaxID=408580 RepID=UPI0009EC065A|nr:Jag N-terminal domain-containing protein [Bacillus coahuilensis]
MNSVTATGNTIDEAIASGLAQLHIEEKQAEITVVEEGKKDSLDYLAINLLL